MIENPKLNFQPLCFLTLGPVTKVLLIALTVFSMLVSAGLNAESETSTEALQDTAIESSSNTVSSDENSSSAATQRKLGRIVAILRYEARLAAQEVAREQAKAEQEIRFAGHESAKERAKERYEVELASSDAARERAKERYEVELASKDAGKEKAKERYESEIASSDAAKERAKERYESEIASHDAAKEKARERYETELASQDVGKERAKERYETELASQDAVDERAKVRYETELAAQDAAKKRTLALLEKTDQTHENALKIEIFRAMDSNNNSKLSRVEFETGVEILDALKRQDYPGLEDSEPVQTATVEGRKESDQFEAMDANQDGSLSLTEFQSAVERIL